MPKTIKPILLALAIIFFSAALAYAAMHPRFHHRRAHLQTGSADSQIAAVQNTKTWGIYSGDDYSSLQSFEQKVEGQPDIAALFLNFSDAFPNDFASYLKQSNQTLLIYWEQYNAPLDDIIAGKFDDYIRQFSRDASLYEGELVLVPLHEMNGNWDSWGGTVGSNTPQKVVLAFRHIHDVFLSVENPNVRWGWAVNNDSVPDTQENSIANYYPGDNYVDYVGVDGFNFGNPWKSYAEVFSSALDQLRSYNKPIYIFSMASAEGPQKADWISDAINQINSDSNIEGWIWFNENKEKDWTVWSDQSSLQAFKSAIK
jgi:beta-mannanase